MRSIFERVCRLSSLLVLLLGAAQSLADTPFDAARKVLEQHCVECHGGAFTKAGFDLTTRDGLLKGGDSGSAFDTDQPEASSLLARITHAVGPGMPFKRAKLGDSEVAAIREWLEAGAQYAAPLTRPTGETWWSLKPLVKPVPPAVTDRGFNPIDLFIQQKLQAKGLSTSKEADRRTLLRRVSFDLIGLPPTFEEVEAFVSDPSLTAYEQAVDRLLASPHYGERWARHWMDVVHYAETHGHDQDRPRPNAWPYRDYLIRSFNADTPYGRFIEEQIAGDVLFPEDPQAAIALGLLATGPWDESSLMSIRDDTIDKKIAQYLDRDDMVTTAMATFTSTTVHCARCHEHKFDPIPQADYYRLQAVFAGVDKADRTYEPDPEIAQQRRELVAEKKRLASLSGTADTTLLAEAVQARVAEWERSAGEAQKQWVPLDVTSAVAMNGSTLTKQPDGSFLASGERPEKETYTFKATVNLPTITGMRLDVLCDESLPHKGPGRQDNGNLHLNEWRVTSKSALAAEAVEQPITLRNAIADFDQSGWTIAHAIDNNPGTAWGIHPQVGKPHRAVVEFAEPVTGPVVLTIVLEQTHGASHLIGRPRLLVTSAKTPLPLDASVLPTEIAEAFSTPVEKRSDVQKAALGRHVLMRDLEDRLNRLPAVQKVYAAASDFPTDGSFKATGGTPREVRLLNRGDINKPGELAVPGALSCVSGLPAEFTLTNAQSEGERRAALAKWLSDSRNVLVWRSIANRVWHHHFGRGLCDTPNDLGRMGGVPSHPELVDWLAVSLQESGGSLKALHRLIVTSAAYRQSSSHDARAVEIDSENRLLWRMTRTRLDAECVRDAMLAATESLDRTMGGPSVKQFIETPGIHVTPNVDYAGFDPDAPANFRRSTYRFIFRTLPDPFMDTLDCADASQLTPARNVSVSALQALSMLNNRFTVRQAEHLAARAKADRQNLRGQVDAIYRRLLSRHASEAELRSVAAYAEKHGLGNACRVLLNSNEFLFVD